VPDARALEFLATLAARPEQVGRVGFYRRLDALSAGAEALLKRAQGPKP
jgi:hypothetical protein